MLIKGELDTYEVKWKQVGFTYAEPVIYKERSVLGFFKYLKMVDYECTYSTIRRSQVEQMTPDVLEAYFQEAVKRYETYLLNAKNATTKKESSKLKTLNEYSNMMWNILAVVLSLVLIVSVFHIATTERNDPVLVSEQVHRFTLLRMYPPKHFYVELESVNKDFAPQKYYVSKHCNAYRDNKLGDEYNVVVKTWRRKTGETFNTLENLNGVFC